MPVFATKNDELIVNDEGGVPAFVYTFITAYLARDVIRIRSSNIERIAASPLLYAYMNVIIKERQYISQMEVDRFYGCEYYCDESLNGLSWRIEELE